jgi:myo-inositol-1(or 4)-monophosphatase
MRMDEELHEYLRFARETAYQAGRLTLEYFNKGVVADAKADGSPVTIADRKAEELIRRAVEQRYPDHAVLGEEFGESRAGASRRWIVDPIDGTKSFIHGVPLYGVLLGLEIDGVVEVGVAYFPALEEMISAASGLGCWWNGKPAHVSTLDRLDKGVVCFTDLGGFWQNERWPAFERLARRASIRAGWSDAYGYMLVASGRVEVMLDPVMAVWDCGPFPPIFREAGGYFGDWKGNPTIYGQEAVATSLALKDEVIGLLNG